MQPWRATRRSGGGLQDRRYPDRSPHLGITADNPFRIQAGCEYALEEAEGRGNVFLPMAVLLEKAGQVLGGHPPRRRWRARSQRWLLSGWLSGRAAHLPAAAVSR